MNIFISARKTVPSLLFRTGISVPVFAQKKSNIVLVLADDMGYSDLACYGSPVIQTPFLDAMVTKGGMATNFVAISPTYSSSRASLLSSRYCTRTNLTYVIGPSHPSGLNPQEITIAEMLKPAGYATACADKWHLGDYLPNKQGFDFFMLII